MLTAQVDQYKGNEEMERQLKRELQNLAVDLSAKHEHNKQMLEQIAEKERVSRGKEEAGIAGEGARAGEKRAEAERAGEGQGRGAEEGAAPGGPETEGGRSPRWKGQGGSWASLQGLREPSRLLDPREEAQDRAQNPKCRWGPAPGRGGQPERGLRQGWSNALPPNLGTYPGFAPPHPGLGGGYAPR